MTELDVGRMRWAAETLMQECRLNAVLAKIAVRLDSVPMHGPPGGLI